MSIKLMLFGLAVLLVGYEYSGWYQHPTGTVADLAKADDLDKDEISVEEGQLEMRRADTIISNQKKETT